MLHTSRNAICRRPHSCLPAPCVQSVGFSRAPTRQNPQFPIRQCRQMHRGSMAREEITGSVGTRARSRPSFDCGMRLAFVPTDLRKLRSSSEGSGPSPLRFVRTCRLAPNDGQRTARPARQGERSRSWGPQGSAGLGTWRRTPVRVVGFDGFAIHMGGTTNCPVRAPFAACGYVLQRQNDPRRRRVLPGPYRIRCDILSSHRAGLSSNGRVRPGPRISGLGNTRAGLWGPQLARSRPAVEVSAGDASLLFSPAWPRPRPAVFLRCRTGSAPVERGAGRLT